MLKSTTNIIQDNYPGTNKKVYIINSGSFFTALWNLLTKILDKRITSRITLLDKDYMKTLEQEMDIENLPICIGGKSEVKINDFKNIWEIEYQ